MLNPDDILQNKLAGLESGQPLTKALEDLSSETAGLEPLIRLAAAIRNMPHPEQEPEVVQAQRRQVLEAAQMEARPPQTQPAPSPSSTLPRQSQPFWAGWPSWKRLGGAAVAAAAGAAVFLCFVLSAGIGLWLNSRLQDTARVETVIGQVQAANDQKGGTWKNLEAGDRVRQGQRLRTLGASYAALVFSEGSHTFLSTNTDITLARLNAASGGRLQVEIIQESGETQHQVTPLQGSESFFLVRTPAGAASVRGTNFSVKVGPGGLAHFAVNTGAVEVKKNGQTVPLAAGQATAARPDGAIDPPSYQLKIQGSLLAVDEAAGIWNVSGMDFQVGENTIITAAPQLGDEIIVTGRVRAGLPQLADAIQPAGNDVQTSYFTGTLDSLSSDSAVIGGIEVRISPETRLADDLKIGQTVRAAFNLLMDQTWAALEISPLAADPPDPDAAPTSTADPLAMPSYEFVPDELETGGCESANSYSLTGTLRNTASSAKDYAADVRLGYLIDRGGEYIKSVTIDPAGWSRLSAGQSVSFTIHVEMNETWPGAPEGTEAKLRIYIASAANRPDHLNGRLTVTISAGCEAETTPTLTSTPTSSLTPDLTQTPTPEAAETGQCTGADPHPTGKKLAQRYGVTYEEIMRWFCTGRYGFGEIDLAYSLSRQSGKPVGEIFAMRASGMGWGDIKKALLENLDEDLDDKNDKDKKDHKDKKDR